MPINIWALTKNATINIVLIHTQDISIDHILCSHKLCMVYTLVDTEKLYLKAATPIYTSLEMYETFSCIISSQYLSIVNLCYFSHFDRMRKDFTFWFSLEFP